jgi:hypothetical protein
MKLGQILKILLCVVVIGFSIIMNTVLAVVMGDTLAGLISAIFIVGSVIVLIT